MILDYYSILGVLQTASSEEIRKAYHSKAKIYHPDLYAGIDGDRKFKLLNEAYRTLISPEKRRRYDFRLKYGYTSEQQSQADKDRMRRYSINYETLRKRREENRRATEHLRKRFKMFDRFIFWSLLLLGSAGLVFGIIDLIVNMRIHGIIFSVIITFIIIYTYMKLGNPKKQ